MQAPLKKKTEIKVYILYVMKNIGYPVSFRKLNDTITADEPVGIFDFTECFSELLDTGNVESVDIEGEECFVITERGVNVADSLLYMLIPGVQKTALAAATRLVSFEKRGSKLELRVTEENEGYRLSFTILERNRQRFLLELFSDNKEQVDQIERNLKSDPEAVYKNMMAMLSGQINYLSY